MPIVVIVGESWTVTNEGFNDSECLSVIDRERDLARSSSVGRLVGSSQSHDLELLLGSGLPLCNWLSLCIFADEELVVTLARELGSGDWCSDNVLRCGAEWVFQAHESWWIGHTHVRRGSGGQETEDGCEVLHDGYRFIAESRFEYEGMR